MESAADYLAQLFVWPKSDHQAISSRSDEADKPQNTWPGRTGFRRSSVDRGKKRRPNLDALLRKVKTGAALPNLRASQCPRCLAHPLFLLHPGAHSVLHPIMNVPVLSGQITPLRRGAPDRGHSACFRRINGAPWVCGNKRGTESSRHDSEQPDPQDQISAQPGSSSRMVLWAKRRTRPRTRQHITKLLYGEFEHKAMLATSCPINRQQLRARFVHSSGDAGLRRAGSTACELHERL